MQIIPIKKKTVTNRIQKTNDRYHRYGFALTSIYYPHRIKKDNNDV